VRIAPGSGESMNRVVSVARAGSVTLIRMALRNVRLTLGVSAAVSLFTSIFCVICSVQAIWGHLIALSSFLGALGILGSIGFGMCSTAYVCYDKIKDREREVQFLRQESERMCTLFINSATKDL
jgi:hypothetical protein